MFALFSRILKLSGRYKGRLQGAFVCAFLESILSKMPIFLAFVILSGFAAGTLTGQTCLYVGLGLAAAVLVPMLVHYLTSIPPIYSTTASAIFLLAAIAPAPSVA